MLAALDQDFLGPAGFYVGISGLTAAQGPGSHITGTRAWIQKEVLSCLLIRGNVEVKARREVELLFPAETLLLASCVPSTVPGLYWGGGVTIGVVGKDPLCF